MSRGDSIKLILYVEREFHPVYAYSKQNVKAWNEQNEFFAYITTKAPCIGNLYVRSYSTVV